LESGFSDTPADSSVVGFWWGCYITANVVGRVSESMANSVVPEVKTYFPVAYLLSSILMIAAAILAISIVRRVTKSQEMVFEQMNRYAPPPPPAFSGQ